MKPALLTLLAAVPFFIREEGTRKGLVDELNCVGSALTCSKVNGVGTLTLGVLGADVTANYGAIPAEAGATVADVTVAGAATTYGCFVHVASEVIITDGVIPECYVVSANTVRLMLHCTYSSATGDCDPGNATYRIRVIP